jgi:hypothetical protein
MGEGFRNPKKILGETKLFWQKPLTDQAGIVYNNMMGINRAVKFFPTDQTRIIMVYYIDLKSWYNKKV